MILEYRIRRNDTLPKLRHTLLLNGAAVNVVAAAVSLTRVRRNDGVSVPVTGTIAIIDGPNGIVEYSPSLADTATEAVYDIFWVLQWVGNQLTVPTDCPVRMLVLD